MRMKMIEIMRHTACQLLEMYRASDAERLIERVHDLEDDQEPTPHTVKVAVGTMLNVIECLLEDVPQRGDYLVIVEQLAVLAREARDYARGFAE